MQVFGKMLVFLGFIFILVGGIILLFQKISFLGKLPGDIFFRKGNFTFYFPIATSILISIVLTLVLNLISKIFKGK